MSSERRVGCAAEAFSACSHGAATSLPTGSAPAAPLPSPGPTF